MEPVTVTAKEEIENIRSEFMIGPDKLRIQDSLNESITHLALSLYKKTAHFILELIQNAEDNQYSEEVEPTLIFNLLDQDPSGTPNSDGALLIKNNEYGFKSEHVSALCAVGKSTKQDKSQGYIGEKGIGFKSVFMVTSQPHIFSGEYQFKFMENSDPEVRFQYIVPTWVNERFEVVNDVVNKTCILLPLKNTERKLVEEQLGQIAPETILFLKKIKGLQIQKNGHEHTKVSRIDQRKPLVEIGTHQGDAIYWLIEKDYLVPAEVQEEKREGINNRVVSVAFPLESSFSTQETIYAFLPTSVQSGFNFLVNADFILAANRENILEDLPWNRWLRDCITSTFLETFKKLLKKKEYRFHPYRHIPLSETNRDSFFQPVVDNIITGLKAEEIVWTFDGKSLEAPENTRFAPKDLRNLLITKNFPKQLAITPLVHPELELEEYRPFLKEIGVKSLMVSELVECLKDENWLKNNHKADWFFKLYQYLSSNKWADASKLEKIKLVLAENGEIICGHAEWVFIPDKQALEITRSHPEIFEFLGVQYMTPLQKRLDKTHPDCTLLDWWIV